MRGKPTAQSLEKQFSLMGKLESAISASNDAGLFTFPQIRRRFRDDDLLADLKKFATAYPAEQRTMFAYLNWLDRKYHPHTIVAQLGGWRAALSRADIRYAAGKQGPSAENVADDLRRFARMTPHVKRTKEQFKSWRGRTVSVASVAKHYGNWHRAMTALGISVPGQTNSEKHSDEEILVAIERVWRWRKRPPSSADFSAYSSSHEDGVSYGTVYNRFGPVTPFLGAFVEWKAGRVSTATLLSWGRKKRTSRTAIPPRIRYAVLRAQNSTCKRCGRSPTRSPGTMVEVDHITPVSKGGTNALENLQVLCFACNRGKFSKVES